MTIAIANDNKLGVDRDNEQDCTDYGLHVGQYVEVVGFYHLLSTLYAVFISAYEPPAFHHVPAHFLTPEPSA